MDEYLSEIMEGTDDSTLIRVNQGIYVWNFSSNYQRLKEQVSNKFTTFDPFVSQHLDNDITIYIIISRETNLN